MKNLLLSAFTFLSLNMSCDAQQAAMDVALPRTIAEKSRLVGSRLTVVGCLRLEEFTTLYASADDAKWARVERGLGLDVGRSTFPDRQPLEVGGDVIELTRLPAEATVTGAMVFREGISYLKVERIRTTYEKCRETY